MEFALKLVETLYGDQKATDVAQSMLVDRQEIDLLSIYENIHIKPELTSIGYLC